MYTSAILRTTVLYFSMWTLISAGTDTNIDYNNYRSNLLEVRLPMVKVGPNGSYFGFSVAEHRVDFSSTEGRAKPHGATESVLLVGAPIYDELQTSNDVERPGDVFRCPYTTYFDDCEPLNIDGTGNSILENKTDQWLGVNVRSQGPAGQVVVCAHRYRMLQGTDGFKWAVGKCYLIKQNVYNLAFIDSPERTREWIQCDSLNMKLDGYGYCQAGTGLGLTTFKNKDIDDNDEYMYMAVGAPGSFYFRGTTFMQDISTSGAEDYFLKFKSNFDNVPASSYGGFSISVGQFKKEAVDNDPNFIVSGAPRRNGSGTITVLKYVSGFLKTHQVIVGLNLTESFGFETVVIDINGDGFNDIVVGAPMHYNRKELIGGRIYLFLSDQSNKGLFGKITTGENDQYINGPLDSMFGIAMANLGDVNGDDAEELVVGAPYENYGEGAVYIYMGSKDGKLGQPIQKITPRTLNADLKGAPLPNITFGYSLSAGMDLDDNKFPDLLIGAFQSSSVILLRTRPIVTPQYEIITEPKNLTAHSTYCSVEGIDKQCVTVKLDILYLCAAIYDSILELDITLEADIGRLDNDHTSRVGFIKTEPDSLPPHIMKAKITLEEQETPYETEDYILVFEEPPFDIYTPVKIRISLSLPDVNATMPEPGQDVPSLDPFPILDPNTVTTKVVMVNFTKKCDQDDGVCITDLRVNASLMLPIGDDGMPVYTYGEDSSLVLRLNVDNHGEDAYDAKVLIHVSDVLKYDRDTSGICQGDTEEPNKAICVLGNPFDEMDKKMTSITFLKNEIQPSQGTLQFNISATSTTFENNPEDNTMFLSAQVQSQTDLELTVIGNKPQYEFSGQVRGECAMENIQMIGNFVQHNWTIFNAGPSVVPEVLVTINYPYETKSGKWILYLTEEPKILGGVSSRCILPENAVDVLNLTHPRGKDEDGNVKTCFPRNNGRQRREQPIRPTPQAQIADKRLKLGCHSKNPTANCFLIKCFFTQLGNREKVKIIINSRLWNSTFLEDYSTQDKLHIEIKGGLEISNGTYIKQRNYNNDRQVLTMEVHRDFKGKGKPQSVKWWVILLAVIGGLLLLILIIFLLWKCGFFERKTMNYQYASVEQKSSGRKGKKDKTYMANDVHYVGDYE